ncbi:uncharacterized [Tachysurus ichikawai]
MTPTETIHQSFKDRDSFSLRTESCTSTDPPDTDLELLILALFCLARKEISSTISNCWSLTSFTFHFSGFKNMTSPPQEGGSLT